MRYVILAALLFLFACNPIVERKAGTGIYFVEEKNGAGTYTVYGPDSAVHFLDTNAALTENDFSNLTYYSIRDTFELELTGKGRERYKFLRYKSGGKQAAIIVAGKLIGLFTIPTDVYAYTLETALLADIGWTRVISDSMNRRWKMREDTLPRPPRNGAWKDHYASGKLYEEGEYKAGIPLWKKGYFESGTLVYEMADSARAFSSPFSSYFREYYPDGKMAWEEFGNMDSVRSYFPDGRLSSEIDWLNEGQISTIVYRTFSGNGDTLLEEREELLPNLPGYTGIGYCPRLVHHRKFTEGKVATEGQLYRDGPYQHGDSTGVWTFYGEDPARVKHFPAWENLHARSVEKALKEQQE